jgi:hypothetical protein
MELFKLDEAMLKTFLIKSLKMVVIPDEHAR